MKRSITRREFIRETLAGAGLAVAITMTPLGARILSAKELASGEFAPGAWLKITPDELVTVYVAKSEMGQGISTSLPMLVAEELEADWKNVRFVFAPAADQYKDPVWGMQATGGSTSIRHLYEPLRLAGAAARELLIAAAAREWKVSAGECLAVNGIVRHGTTMKSITYGQLAGLAADLSPPAKPKLKSPRDFRFIGKDLPRLDVLDKVNGTAVFGIDVTIPGMLHAAIAHPPAFGARPTGYDEAAAGKVKGVKKVVAIDSGVAVCASSTAAARKGLAALQVRWDTGSSPQLTDESLRRQFRDALGEMGLVARNDGDVGTALAAAKTRLSATFELPFLAHVTMEPMNCT
ncbi:MAG TPA: molybdopterin cofactor-binding domain-containing protein, partial [Geobacteraceae bacterium]